MEKDWEALSFLRGGALEDDSSSDEEGDSDVESDSDSETESEDSDESEEDSDSDDESESEVEESDSEAEESSDDEEETDSDYEEESSDEEEETEPETSISTKTSQSKASSSDAEEYDEPLSFSPMQDMGVTLGVMILCNRLDLNNAKIVKVARFAFIGYLVVAQIFLIYVRYKARIINDTTPITINNAISSIVQSQLPSSSGGMGGDMVKNLANSFLASESTILDYDLNQAKNMNSSLLIPMVMLWFLHFKMGQVQPLFHQTVSGVKELLVSPLFQVYILGRNLERPFKNKKLEAMQKQEEEAEVVTDEDQSDNESEENEEDSDAVEEESDDETDEYDDDEYDSDAYDEYDSDDE